MNKHLVIEGVAAAVGVAAGAATAYFANDPQLGAAIGGTVYLSSKALGYFDPGTSVPAVTVTPGDIKDALQAVSDAQAKNYGALAGDLATVVRDAQAVIASASTPVGPVVVAPAPVPATPNG